MAASMPFVHILRLTAVRVVPWPHSLAILGISAGRRVHVLVTSVQLVVDILQFDVLGLVPTASGPVSLVLQGREAITQVLQSLGIVLTAVIVELLPSAPSASPIEGPLVLLLQKIVLLVVVVVVSAPLLLLLMSPPGLGCLGPEGIVVVQE